MFCYFNIRQHVFLQLFTLSMLVGFHENNQVQSSPSNTRKERESSHSLSSLFQFTVVAFSPLKTPNTSPVKTDTGDICWQKQRRNRRFQTAGLLNLMSVFWSLHVWLWCVCVGVCDWVNTPQEYGALVGSQRALCVSTPRLNHRFYQSPAAAPLGLLSFCLFHFLSGSSPPQLSEGAGPEHRNMTSLKGVVPPTDCSSNGGRR